MDFLVMETIYKYELKIEDKQEISMQLDAEILSVQTQGDSLCMWALVDPEVEPENRMFEIFGTGHPIPVGMGVSREFISTFQIPSRGLVFHVFERIN
jgi:hypothetical protein